MLIIDSHAHIFKEINGITRFGKTISSNYGKIDISNSDSLRFLPPLAIKTSFTDKLFIEYMDWAGVHKAVLLQSPFYGVLNDYIYSSVRKWPNRFVGAAYLDPWQKNAQKNFNSIGKYNFKIIKLDLAERFGFFGLYPYIELDGNYMKWFWTECNKQEKIIVLDMGPVGSISYQTKRLENVLKRYTNLKIVICHLAHAPINKNNSEKELSLWKSQLLLAKKFENVWIDLAIHPCGICFEDYPYRVTQGFIKEAIELIGPSRLLWGSDMPGILIDVTYPKYLDFFLKQCSFINNDDLEKIMGKNSFDLFFKKINLGG